MKLKNKKTGEIIERYIIETASNIGAGLILQDNDTGKHYQYGSLAELNEEWEDAPEEPKEYWYIDPDANIERTSKDDEYDDEAKQIGNYFESLEEAKQAVEKLKAWKRLKDKGFRFTQQPFDLSLHTVYFTLDGQYKYTDETAKDIDLIFGGKNGE